MANEVRIEITGDTKGIDRSVSDLQGRLQKMGSSMQSVGKKMTMGLTLPVVALGAVAVKMGGDFQASMNKVRAVSGATGADFAALSAQAKELGRTTQYSASQAAEGMSFLAMAGFDANEVLGAMPATLQLAAAGQMDLAQAADIASNILTGYQMTTEELTHANDVLVKTFTSTNTDLIMLGEAFKYVAPVASSAGVRFEEVSAAIGLLGNAGIQATMAGTSLRGAISRLLTPTGEAADILSKLGVSTLDAQGNLISLEEIVRQLEQSGATTGDMLTLFGDRAGPAMAALVGQGADALEALTAQLVDSGGAAENIAAVQMEGFNGAMRKMKSALEGAAIAFVESGILDMFQKIVEWVAKAAEKFANLPKPLLIAIAAVAGLAAVIGPMLLILGTFLTLLPKLTIALRAFAVASRLAAGPWGLILAAVAAIGGGFLMNKLMGSGSVPGLQHGGGLPEGVSMVGEAGPELAVKRGGRVEIIPTGKVPGFQGGTFGAGDIASTAFMKGLLDRFLNVILPALWSIPPAFLTQTKPTGAQAIANKPLQDLLDALNAPSGVSDEGPGVISHDVIGTYYAWARAVGDVTKAVGAASSVYETAGDAAQETSISYADAVEGMMTQFRILNTGFAQAAAGAGNVGDVLTEATAPMREAAAAQGALIERIGLGNQAGFAYTDTLDKLNATLGDAGLASQVAGQMLTDHLNASLVEMAGQLPGGVAILDAMTASGMTLEEQFRMLYDATAALPAVLEPTIAQLLRLPEATVAWADSMGLALTQAGIAAGIAHLPDFMSIGNIPGGETGVGVFGGIATSEYGPGMVKTATGIKSWKEVFPDLYDRIVNTGAPGLPGLPEMQSGGYVPGPRNRPFPAILHGGETVIPAGQAGVINITITGDIYGMLDFEDKVVSAVVAGRARGASV